MYLYGDTNPRIAHIMVRGNIWEKCGVWQMIHLILSNIQRIMNDYMSLPLIPASDTHIVSLQSTWATVIYLTTIGKCICKRSTQSTPEPSAYFMAHYRDVIMRWRLKSPPSRLFVQPFVQAQIKENIIALRNCPLWGEPTGDRWIPRTQVY